MSTEVPTLHDMAAGASVKDKPVKPETSTSAAERAIANDAAKRERERLDRRKEIRQQIKERGALMLQLEDLAEQLRLLDGRADQAAEKHAEATAPIQTALEGATGSKRAAMLEKLTAANLDLEREVDIIARTRNPLLKRHRLTRDDMARLPTGNRLAGRDLGNPRLLAELHAGECRRAAAQARIERAREQLSQVEPALEYVRSVPVRPSSDGWTEERGKLAIDTESVHKLQQRIMRWRCELTHASEEHQAAVEAMAEIQRDLVSE